MKEYRGVKVGQIWEDTENGDPDFEVIAISEKGEITYRQYGQNETTDFSDFIDWAESNCFSPKDNHEGFWLTYFHNEMKGFK